MKELIGKRCVVEFDLPDMKWPINGWPARATVEAVDMPMVKLVALHTSKEIWVNVAIIKTIEVEVIA